MKKVNKGKNKRGISEIVAYAIMIAIAIGLATAVFAWYRVVVQGTEPAIDCKDGTSVYLDNYRCDTPVGSDTALILAIRNNGGFDVNGVIVRVSYDAAKEPADILNPIPAPPVPIKGYFDFFPELKPGEAKDATFKSPAADGAVKRVSIQPYIFDKEKNNKRVVCQGTLIKQPITGNGCS